ncbi:glycosyltransferase WbuB [Comamonas serinivorans]|uniref:Glycosyltransferase WbuB n=1 Tax=Comamonas serinivorans TaxID=1082851 RepID=A0A1Y0ERF6_9BURK|nr:glycosyltransferase family 4 protein [Comamonas serinivorans]ARU06193.1 glycosyltransferase WbuB [Comamonas serinivorans]
MNLLYLNHYAGGPDWGMEFRPWYLAREWARLGHRVDIVAATYSHVRSAQPQAGQLLPPVLRGSVGMSSIEDVRWHWYAADPYQGNGVGRVRNIGQFLGRVAWHAPTLARQLKPDVVIASSTYPMDIWVAARLAREARRLGARGLLVHEVHDLWPLSPIELGGMSPTHPFIRLCQAAEDWACRHADRVVSMLPNVAEHLRAHGLPEGRLHIVGNGISPDDWHTAEPAPLRPDLAQHLARLRAEGACVVGYAGSHGTPNAMEHLLLAAARLQTESEAGAKGPTLAFVLVGDGHEKAALQAQAQALGLRHLHFFDPVPKAQVPAFLAQVDVAYIGWQDLPIYRFGIAPNKLFDYMMAARPVLHSVAAANDPVALSGCGLTVAPADPQAIAQGLRELAALSPERRAVLGAQGQAYVLAHHTWPVLAQRFLHALA